MTTKYPFRLLDHLVSRLPPPASDGLCDIDVKVNGAWDGVCVASIFGMYSMRGFPLFRPLTAMVGLAQILHGAFEILVWLKKGG